MDPGTDRRKLAAAWCRLERRRRGGTRLAMGTALLLGGTLALVLGATFPARLCSQGAGYAECVTSSPGAPVRVALLLTGLSLTVAGVQSVRRAFGTDG
ncbi:hypothetical protein [Halomarina litorea]|uniref:hypothetical protein n=1 Tax=Halomarina litorea TaxID=2961595 RepID=UPI0020C4BC04|nr:hypothetical protein [Halomarina sp. BCD28]